MASSRTSLQPTGRVGIVVIHRQHSPSASHQMPVLLALEREDVPGAGRVIAPDDDVLLLPQVAMFQQAIPQGDRVHMLG